MRFFNTQKNTILVVMAILILSGMIYFLNQQSYQKLAELKVQQQDKTTELEAARIRLQTLESQNLKADDINAKKDYVTSQLPVDVEATLFASELEQLGKKLNVTPLSVSILTTPDSPSTKASSLSPSNYALTLTTPFGNFLNVLAEMEKFDRLNTIESISLSPTQSDLNISIGGTIFRLKGSAK